jgi:hypothetical protein
MTSGNGFFPSLRSSQAASKIACACISVISGYSMPRRQPRKPSMGLNSCMLSTLALIRSTGIPLFWDTSRMSSSVLGRNSCSGGSRVRMVTGRFPMMPRMPLKSSFCMGRSLARAFFLPSRSEARIISRTASIRSPSKNMCSVRQSPIPSPPNCMVTCASFGVSALARTPIFRHLSAQLISNEKSPESSGWISLASPSRTSPVLPSRVMYSPRWTLRSLAKK